MSIKNIIAFIVHCDRFIINPEIIDSGKVTLILKNMGIDP